MMQRGHNRAEPPVRTRDAFASQPPEHREGLIALRALILEVAAEVDAVPAQESLKWGQPSFTSARPLESTAVRVASTADGEHFGLFVHCQSTVISEFRDVFPNEFHYDGNRAILFRPGDDLQPDRLRLCIEHALRYRVPSQA